MLLSDCVQGRRRRSSRRPPCPPPPPRRRPRRAAAAAGEIRGRVLVGRHSRPPASPCPCCRSRTASPPPGARRAARTCRRPLATATTRPDGTFAVALPGRGRHAPVRLAFVRRRRRAPSCSTALLDAGGEDAGDVRLPRALAARRPGGGRARRARRRRDGDAVARQRAAAAGRAPRLRPCRSRPRRRPTAAFRFEVAAEDGNRLRVEAPGVRDRRSGEPRAGGRPRAAGRRSRSGQVLRGTVTLADRRTAGRRAPSCGSRGARRRRAGSRRGRTARSSSTARRARPARWWPTAATAAAPRSSLGAGAAEPVDDRPRRRPRRSPGAWWTPPTASRSPASASWPAAPGGASSSPARARTAATRCAACRPQSYRARRRGRPLRAVVAHA